MRKKHQTKIDEIDRNHLQEMTFYIKIIQQKK